MRIEIAVDLHYRLTGAPAASLALEAAEAPGQRILSRSFEAQGAWTCRLTGDDGVGERIWLRPARPELTVAYRAELELTGETAPLESLSAAPPWELPAEAAPYLRASRYIEADRFQPFVTRKFGEWEGGAKIAAMRDWVERAFEYVPGTSDTETTAVDSFALRQGVCRDYAHVLCALARAARIPARCAAVYGPDVTPMDFHLVAQVWLDGAWRLVDPSGMCAPGEMALIAVGRDVGDVAFMETEDPAILLHQSVQVRRV